MLYALGFVQILVYLLFAPIVHQALWGVEHDLPPYPYSVAAAFLVPFLVARVLRRRLAAPPPLRFEAPKMLPMGTLAVAGWAVVYIVISLQFGLFDRRIGTEEAALKFANIPLVVLVAFRSFEVALPYFAAIGLVAWLQKMTSRRLLFIATLAGAFLASGVLNSRSQAFLFLLTILVLAQNHLPAKTSKRVLWSSILIAAIALVYVTFGRLNAAGEMDHESYIGEQVVRRLDGLELLSRIVEVRGEISFFGEDASAILIPLQAAIPFTEAATQLKADALTGVKQVVLDRELLSEQRDVNSFVILDVYYLFGVLGVAFSGFSLGAALLWVDRNVNLSSVSPGAIFCVAVAINCVVLEREAVAIVIAIARDWALLMLLSKLLLSNVATLDAFRRPRRLITK